MLYKFPIPLSLQVFVQFTVASHSSVSFPTIPKCLHVLIKHHKSILNIIVHTGVSRIVVCHVLQGQNGTQTEN